MLKLTQKKEKKGRWGKGGRLVNEIENL